MPGIWGTTPYFSQWCWRQHWTGSCVQFPDLTWSQQDQVGCGLLRQGWEQSKVNLVSVSVAHLFCTHDHSLGLWRPHRGGEGLEFSPLPRRQTQRWRSPKTSPTGVLTYWWDTIQSRHSANKGESTGPKRDTGGIQVHGTLGNSQVPLCHTWVTKSLIFKIFNDSCLCMWGCSHELQQQRTTFRSWSSLYSRWAPKPNTDWHVWQQATIPTEPSQPQSLQFEKKISNSKHWVFHNEHRKIIILSWSHPVTGSTKKDKAEFPSTWNCQGHTQGDPGCCGNRAA